MVPLRGLPFLLRVGMTVALTPPSLTRDRFCAVTSVNEVASRATFSGIASIDDAQAIVGCHVLARADDVVLDAFEVPFADLIGRGVHDERYGDLGTIEEVMETPANNVWVVSGSSYGEVLIPVIADVVRSLPDSGTIEVRIMDGLIDEAPSEGAIR